MNAELSKLLFFILIISAVALEVAGDIFFKKWSLDSKNLLLAIGLLVYFIGTVFWAVSLKYEFLSRAISVFTIMNLIIVSLAGVIIFKEDLSVVNKLGIALGALSIILVEL
jgi:multidrug transporter EmrE-like cation transporter